MGNKGWRHARPDFLIVANSGIICLEVDENQHNRIEYIPKEKMKEW